MEFLVSNCGQKVNGVCGTYYYGGDNGIGFIFKDVKCFCDENRRDEICYIAEGGFEGHQSITEEQAINNIGCGAVDTHNSLFAYLKDNLVSDFGADKITDEFVERCCEYVFLACEWECLSTFITECDFTEDLNEYLKEKSGL